MKKYIANTVISVSAVLPDGESTRVSFSALMDGTSVYYTNDPDIEWALEHHYKFGKLFRIEAEEIQNQPTKSAPKTSCRKVSGKSAKKSMPPKREENGIPPSEEETDDELTEPNIEIREVTVSDMDAAKDYLSEHFDVIRTKMKTENSIRETALAYGIEFKYL